MALYVKRYDSEEIHQVRSYDLDESGTEHVICDDVEGDLIIGFTCCFVRWVQWRETANRISNKSR